MTAFEECMASAVKQNQVSQEQADELIDRWNEYADAFRRSGERDVEAGARPRSRVLINAQVGGPLSGASRKTFPRSEHYWF
jgi:hypothetical protein